MFDIAISETVDFLRLLRCSQCVLTASCFSEGTNNLEVSIVQNPDDFSSLVPCKLVYIAIRHDIWGEFFHGNIRI